MDYDIIDDTRPRLHLGPAGASHLVERSLNEIHAGICVSVGVVLVGLGWTLVGSLQLLAVWVGLSLVVGPFAPPWLTGGDCRVGVGEPLLPEKPSDDHVDQIGPRSYRSREKHTPRKDEVLREEVENGVGLRSAGSPQQFGKSSMKGTGQEGSSDAGEKEWTSEEVDLLKRLVVKHPRGTLRRWEVIAEVLGGRHDADSVVKMSKLLGQKKIGDQDAYSRFLAQRKGSESVIASPLSQRDHVPEQMNDNVSHEEGDKGEWTELEDKALLTALKTFRKDSSMRWDKVALAVPGRSKAQCFRRFSDLRKTFRSVNGYGSSHAQAGVE